MMDKIITGLLGVGMFVLFVGGLAQSIGQVPFILIVIFICALAIYGLYEELRTDKN